jgi:hypothetical protein
MTLKRYKEEELTSPPPPAECPGASRRGPSFTLDPGEKLVDALRVNWTSYKRLRLAHVDMGLEQLRLHICEHTAAVRHVVTCWDGHYTQAWPTTFEEFAEEQLEMHIMSGSARFRPPVLPCDENEEFVEGKRNGAPDDED